ncbi:MAG TPA: hypothetical protein VE981_15045 [Planctomycetota bacterium]|nr:hypothetical protein [Planctomycetota bacterium]
MSPPQPEHPPNRRWFVLLTIVTLVGFALFVGAITVCALRIPELKKARYGVLENRAGDRAV